jgi:hypothetical protein
MQSPLDGPEDAEPTATELTTDLIASLTRFVGRLSPEARSKLIAFVHFASTTPDTCVDLKVDANGSAVLTLCHRMERDRAA